MRNQWMSSWTLVVLGGVLATAGCLEDSRAPDPGSPAARAHEDLPTAAATKLAQAQAESLALQAPAGCTEIDAGDFKNGVQLTPVIYSQSPTYRSAITGLGDPAVADSLRIRLDAATSPGLYSLSTPATSNLFTCEQCVFAFADLPATNLFVAEAGALVLAAKVSAEQTFGALVNVTLRQAVAAPPFNAPYTGSAVVPGGSCYWIRFATWNTIRPFGCNPQQGSLTANLPGLTCVPESRAGNDGTLERATGHKKQGATCAYTPAAGNAPASSNCARGYSCTDAFTADRTCLETCDFMAANPGCGNGLVCGPNGLCIEQSVLEPIGFLFEDVAIGEACVNDFAEFCGSEGARGVCVALSGPGTGICYPYERARSHCGAGEELGFVSYPLTGGGFDRTYGWCFPN